MKRLTVVVLAGFFILCTGIFNAAYCNTPNPTQETIEDNTQVEDNEEYSHESVLMEDDESEYEEPKTDDVITNDTDDEVDDSHYAETMEEGEEV